MGYTVWKYFHKPEEGTPDNAGSLQDRYPLYAFTKEKILHKDFESQRDMSQFVVTKTDMEEEEYKDFANSHVNMLLEYIDYTHVYGADKDGKPEKDAMQILSTRSEYDFVDDMKEFMIMDEMCNKQQIFHPLIFKKKYIKALQKLQFIGFWRYSPNNERFYKLLSEEEIDNLEYCELDDIDYDEVNIFMYLYSHQFVGMSESKQILVKKYSNNKDLTDFRKEVVANGG